MVALLLGNATADCLTPYNGGLRGGKRGEGEGLERKCRLEVWEECRKTQRKVKVWRADGGWKCEAGAGRSRGHVRRLSPTNSGGIGFVKVLMSESY